MSGGSLDFAQTKICDIIDLKKNTFKQGDFVYYISWAKINVGRFEQYWYYWDPKFSTLQTRQWGKIIRTSRIFDSVESVLDHLRKTAPKI